MSSRIGVAPLYQASKWTCRVRMATITTMTGYSPKYRKAALHGRSHLRPANRGISVSHRQSGGTTFIESSTGRGNDGNESSFHSLEAYMQHLLLPRPFSWELSILEGSSKKVANMRKCIDQAIHDPHQCPVLVCGEAGMDTVSLAAHIHYSSPSSCGRPLLHLDCSTAGHQKMALEWLTLGDGLNLTDGTHCVLPGTTLLLSNVHKATPSLLQRICRTLQQQGAKESRAPLTSGPAFGRLLLCSQEALPSLQTVMKRALGGGHIITVPALRQIHSDMGPLVAITLSRLAQQLPTTGLSYQKIQVTPGALRRLQSYPFPGNLQELQSLLSRAVLRHLKMGNPLVQNPALVLDVDDFWPATPDVDNGRFSVFHALPWLRFALLDSGLWPEGAQKVLLPFFLATGAVLLWGPQARMENPGMVLFWAGWWPIALLAAPLAGRAWCAVCPFMAIGNGAQSLRAVVDNSARLGLGGLQSNILTALGLRKATSSTLTSSSSSSSSSDSCILNGQLPSKDMGLSTDPEAAQGPEVHSAPKLGKWPAWVQSDSNWSVVALFAAILTWEEVWDLPHTPYLSGWLLLLITGGAVLCSVFFERRMWCRYLCPIGGMCGMYAKLAILEVRANPAICAANSCVRYCHKGISTLASANNKWVDHRGASLQAASVSIDLPSGEVCDAEVWLDEPLAEPVVETGCPMSHSPASLEDNQSCVMCLKCVKACPNENVQLRLRTPGAELWNGTHHEDIREVTLMFVLMGAVPLHRLYHLLPSLGTDTPIWLEDMWHVAMYLGGLATPGVAVFLMDYATRYLSASASDNTLPDSTHSVSHIPAVSLVPQEVVAEEDWPFLAVAYSYLPLVWSATLSYYEPALMTEMGRILQVGAAGLGLSPGFIYSLPSVTVHPAVVAAAQGCTMALGTLAGLLLSERFYYLKCLNPYGLKWGQDSGGRKNVALCRVHQSMILVLGVGLGGLLLG